MQVEALFSYCDTVSNVSTKSLSQVSSMHAPPQQLSVRDLRYTAPGFRGGVVDGRRKGSRTPGRSRRVMGGHMVVAGGGEYQMQPSELESRVAL